MAAGLSCHVYCLFCLKGISPPRPLTADVVAVVREVGTGERPLDAGGVGLARVVAALARGRDAVIGQVQVVPPNQAAGT